MENTRNQNIINAAKAATAALLPAKSVKRYEQAFDIFSNNKWRLQNNVLTTDEDTMLAFFYEKVT